MIAEIIITVGDVDEALSFYTETVGMEYLRRIRVDDASVVLLAAGDVRIALVPGSEADVRVAVASDDVDADQRRLERRGVAPPVAITRSTGGRVLPFTDPWGNHLAFWEQSER